MHLSKERNIRKQKMISSQNCYNSKIALLFLGIYIFFVLCDRFIVESAEFKNTEKDAETVNNSESSGSTSFNLLFDKSRDVKPVRTYERYTPYKKYDRNNKSLVNENKKKEGESFTSVSSQTQSEISTNLVSNATTIDTNSLQKNVEALNPNIENSYEMSKEGVSTNFEPNQDSLLELSKSKNIKEEEEEEGEGEGGDNSERFNNTIKCICEKNKINEETKKSLIRNYLKHNNLLKEKEGYKEKIEFYNIQCPLRMFCCLLEHNSSQFRHVSTYKDSVNKLNSLEYLKIFLSIQLLMTHDIYKEERQTILNRISEKKNVIEQIRVDFASMLQSESAKIPNFDKLKITEPNNHFIQICNMLQYALFINDNNKSFDFINFEQVLENIDNRLRFFSRQIIGLMNCLIHMKMQHRKIFVSEYKQENKHEFLSYIKFFLENVDSTQRNILSTLMQSFSSKSDFTRFFYLELGGLLLQRFLITPYTMTEANFILPAIKDFLMSFEDFDVSSLRRNTIMNATNSRNLHLVNFYGQLQVIRGILLLIEGSLVRMIYVFDKYLEGGNYNVNPHIIATATRYTRDVKTLLQIGIQLISMILKNRRYVRSILHAHYLIQQINGQVDQLNEQATSFTRRAYMPRIKKKNNLKLPFARLNQLYSDLFKLEIDIMS